MQGSKKAFFIVIDGIDGTGKSTQVKRLSDWLNESGYSAVTTFEPGATPAGNKIREILMNGKMAVSPDTEILLFCADRAEHQQKVAALLGGGKSVVCDRFLSSTWAYQIFGRKCDPSLLEAVVPITVKCLPDLTIILDLDVRTAVERAKTKLLQEGKLTSEGRFESENMDFFTRVRDGFLWYANEERFGASVVMNASGNVDEVFLSIKKICREHLGI